MSFKKVVYHPFPTSNHNLYLCRLEIHIVVYHPFPTSNHNAFFGFRFDNWLYIILFLHQTTTTTYRLCRCLQLYIILFLHQTTTVGHQNHNEPKLYIILFLHSEYLRVVYHPFPTSNHNHRLVIQKHFQLYIILFLHQTTTLGVRPL